MRSPLVLAALSLLGAQGLYAHDGPHADSAVVRDLAATCAACHGTEGRSQRGMPALAGQNSHNLSKQLHDFKAGNKPASVMHQIARGYSDEQLDLLADFFSQQGK
jgi:cytochrome subunit of sulfide dehydrogenase